MKAVFLSAFATALMVMIVLSGLPGEHTRPGNHTVNASFQAPSGTVHAELEVADNATERKRGLMHRTELGKHKGMLFVYPGEDDRAFWMKNTLIPLDIIFLNSTKHVINVETAYPEPNVSDSELARYRSEAPAQYVIEVNAGFAENNSIKKGVKVEWD